MRTIKGRFVAAFAVCVLLAMISGGLAIRSDWKLSSGMTTMYHDFTLPIADLAAFRGDSASAQATIARALLFSGDPGEVANDVQTLKSLRERMTSSWRQYYPAGVTSPEEQKIADMANAEFNRRFLPALNGVISVLEQQNMTEAMRQYKAVFIPSATALAASIVPDVDVNARQAKA